MNWIKCSDRLPPIDEVVLIWVEEDSKPCLASIKEGNNPWRRTSSSQDINDNENDEFHWMASSNYFCSFDGEEGLFSLSEIKYWSPIRPPEIEHVD